MRMQSFRIQWVALSGMVTVVLGLALTELRATALSDPASHETRASRAYQVAARQGSLAVQAFLADFPKGADLHFQLSAGVYAETLIRIAAEDKVCIDPEKAQFARDAQGKTAIEPCESPLLPAAELNGTGLSPREQELYDRIVNAFSIRNYVPPP